MKRATKIALALGTAVTLGLAAVTVSANPYGYGPGWGGHMGGYAQGNGMGPGMMGGYGPGYGMGPGMMGGYGQGYGMGPGMMGGYGQGYGMGPGMMGGYGPGYGMGPGMMGGYGPGYGNADENLAGLKAELGITAKQDSAWQAFANNAKKQQETRQAWFEKMHEARTAGSAPEMLAQQSEFMKQRQVEMDANVSALKNLYATLTPEQKEVADQLFGGVGPRWNQGRRGGARGYGR